MFDLLKIIKWGDLKLSICHQRLLTALNKNESEVSIIWRSVTPSPLVNKPTDLISCIYKKLSIQTTIVRKLKAVSVEPNIVGIRRFAFHIYIYMYSKSSEQHIFLLSVINVFHQKYFTVDIFAFYPLVIYTDGKYVKNGINIIFHLWINN